jgi:hypothetical protein
MSEPYVVAEGETIPQLERDVSNYIRQGYVPLGGVCSRQPDQHGRSYLCQAMVRPAVLQGQPKG